MRNVLLLVGIVALGSSAIAGPKCDNAKAVLADNKAALEAATKENQIKLRAKISIPAKLKLLELAIKSNRETACEKLLESLQKDVEALKAAK